MKPIREKMFDFGDDFFVRVYADGSARVDTCNDYLEVESDQATELADHISPTVREEDDGTYTVRLLGEAHTVTPNLSWDDPNEAAKALEYAARIVASVANSHKQKPKWEGLDPSLIAVLKEKDALDSAYTVTCDGKWLGWNEGRNPATLTIAKGFYCASFATEHDETGHLSTQSYDKVCSYEDFWKVALNG